MVLGIGLGVSRKDVTDTARVSITWVWASKKLRFVLAEHKTVSPWAGMVRNVNRFVSTTFSWQEDRRCLVRYLPGAR